MNILDIKDNENIRDSRIRTCDILLPKQARYQTALYPDFTYNIIFIKKVKRVVLFNLLKLI